MKMQIHHLGLTIGSSLVALERDLSVKFRRWMPIYSKSKNR